MFFVSGGILGKEPDMTLGRQVRPEEAFGHFDDLEQNPLFKLFQFDPFPL